MIYEFDYRFLRSELFEFPYRIGLWCLILQSITFETLKVQAGQDAGGVGTDMITMNATLRMLYRNTGTFFGVHVTSTPVDLSFSQIKIGSGSVSSHHFIDF